MLKKSGNILTLKVFEENCYYLPVTMLCIAAKPRNCSTIAKLVKQPLVKVLR